MTEQEFERLWSVSQNKSTICADSLGDRTLLYGYDCDRRTWHLFQRGDKLILHIYTITRTVTLDAKYFWNVDEIVPNKRLYPEACDFDFCRRLREFGVLLPFTQFNPERSKERFYGETEEFDEWDHVTE